MTSSTSNTGQINNAARWTVFEWMDPMITTYNVEYRFMSHRIRCNSVVWMVSDTQSMTKSLHIRTIEQKPHQMMPRDALWKEDLRFLSQLTSMPTMNKNNLACKNPAAKPAKLNLRMQRCHCPHDFPSVFLPRSLSLSRHSSGGRGSMQNG